MSDYKFDRDSEGRPAVYLGDGAYACFDGIQLQVYASDGLRITNRVFIDFDALQRLLHFALACGASMDSLTKSDEGGTDE